MPPILQSAIARMAQSGHDDDQRIGLSNCLSVDFLLLGGRMGDADEAHAALARRQGMRARLRLHEKLPRRYFSSRSTAGADESDFATRRRTGGRRAVRSPRRFRRCALIDSSAFLMLLHENARRFCHLLYFLFLS